MRRERAAEREREKRKTLEGLKEGGGGGGEEGRGGEGVTQLGVHLFKSANALCVCWGGCVCVNLKGHLCRRQWTY